MIKAIVFDLDDTLYPEIDYVKSGFNKVVEYVNKKYSTNITGDFLFDLFLVDQKDVYNRALDKLNVKYDNEIIQQMVKIFRENEPKPDELNVYPGVEMMLKKLSKKYKLAIITDGRVSQQENKIKSLGIAQYFDEIVCSDKFGIEHRKPDELPFKMVKESLGVLYDEMMYVGDNRLKDFAIKKIKPIVTVEVLSKNKVHYSNKYREDIRPDFIINDVTELDKILEIING